jgi:hypothetical protein
VMSFGRFNYVLFRSLASYCRMESLATFNQRLSLTGNGIRTTNATSGDLKQPPTFRNTEIYVAQNILYC